MIENVRHVEIDELKQKMLRLADEMKGLVEKGANPQILIEHGLHCDENFFELFQGDFFKQKEVLK